MFVVPDKETVYFDVDDTLIVDAVNDEPGSFVLDGDSYKPHEKHISWLRGYKKEGLSIVVWSQFGSEWAEQVVEKLNLREFVDVCVRKPYKVFDDLPTYCWLPNITYYFEEKTNEMEFDLSLKRKEDKNGV